jgi:hypothetical protein
MQVSGREPMGEGLDPRPAPHRNRRRRPRRLIELHEGAARLLNDGPVDVHWRAELVTLGNEGGLYWHWPAYISVATNVSGVSRNALCDARLFSGMRAFWVSGLPLAGRARLCSAERLDKPTLVNRFTIGQNMSCQQSFDSLCTNTS